jgi:hypothetical protein
MLAQPGNEWEALAARPHKQFQRFPQQCLESHNYQGFCAMRARARLPFVGQFARTGHPDFAIIGPLRRTSAAAAAPPLDSRAAAPALTQ